jgi:predicted nucleotidyltransferase
MVNQYLVLHINPDNYRDGENHALLVDSKPLGAMATCIKDNFCIHLRMLNLLDIKNTLLAHKQRLSSKYGLSNLAIFGSYARNQQTEESDLDILVEFNRPIGLEFIDLADELEHILKLKVDLVSKKGLKERHLKSIEKELEYV